MVQGLLKIWRRFHWIIYCFFTWRQKTGIELLTCVIKSIKCTPCLLSAKIWSPPFSFPSGTLFTAKKLDPNNGHFHKISKNKVKHYFHDIMFYYIIFIIFIILLYYIIYSLIRTETRTKHLCFTSSNCIVLHIVPCLLDHIWPLLWSWFSQTEHWFW